MDDIKIRRFEDTETSLFGDLICRDYFETSRLKSGLVRIPAGGKGKTDKGHKDSEEVFTVCRGEIIVIFPEMDKEFELQTGDALLVPPDEPHIVENRSKEEAVFTYTVAPKA